MERRSTAARKDSISPRTDPPVRGPGTPKSASDIILAMTLLMLLVLLVCVVFTRFFHG